MSTLPNPASPKDIEDMLALYFDNQATPEVCQAIQAWLEADPANAQTFAEYGYIERMIFCAQRKEDASAVFGMLAEMEANAEAEIVTIVDELPEPPHEPALLSGHDFVLAGGYVLRKALANKRTIVTGITLAVAAVLLLSLVLINPLFRDVPEPIADYDFWDNANEMDPSQTPSPTPNPPSLPASVATLTSSDDARWDTPGGAYAPSTGDTLVAGQRLTLTAGFAEITTNRGAIAFIQAPASIEFTDSPNGLRLHEGKLLGICETESSKGFLVQTPSIDVTDLGTRFGVSVDQAGEALVEVFDGLVLAKPNTIDQSISTARELGVGESMAVDHTGQEVERDPSSKDTFASLAARTHGITQLSGDVVWTTPEYYIGKDISAWPNQASAVVFPEQSSVTLTETLQTSSLSPDATEQPKAILPGTVIRTYILLYRPGTPMPTHSKGSVTFEGEILGVILHDNWDASLHALKSDPIVDLFDVDQFTGTVELYDFDEVNISSNRHELNFNLRASVACDAMRIVVREPAGDKN